MTHLDLVVYTGAAIGFVEIVCIGVLIVALCMRKHELAFMAAISLVVIIMVVKSTGFYEKNPITIEWKTK